MGSISTSIRPLITCTNRGVNNMNPPRLFKYLSTKTTGAKRRVALLLSGCGVYDGTEITEGVSALIHLSRSNADIQMYAPDKPQYHVVNHVTGEEASDDDRRNVLIESARLARGAIKSLDECHATDYDALIIPGGFGAAKNLCDFAIKGSDMSVDPTVSGVIQDFVSKNKVIGLSCIAPVLAAKLIPGVRLTVGMNKEQNGAFPYAGTAEAIEAMGGVHVNTEAPCDTSVVDEEKGVVTCAAYMYAGKPHEIDDSIKAMVDGVLDLVDKRKEA